MGTHHRIQDAGDYRVFMLVIVIYAKTVLGPQCRCSGVKRAPDTPEHTPGGDAWWYMLPYHAAVSLLLLANMQTERFSH